MQKVYKSDMNTGKTLELNDLNGIRIVPDPESGKNGVGIFLSNEDAVDLAVSILKERAPERLAPEPPKLDDRFKVGGFARRKSPTSLSEEGGHNGPLKVIEIRPYTAEERRYRYSAVPEQAVRVYYVTESGDQSHIASNWIEPVEVEEKVTTTWVVKD